MKKVAIPLAPNPKREHPLMAAKAKKSRPKRKVKK
jgi:hypothetical protein